LRRCHPAPSLPAACRRQEAGAGGVGCLPAGGPGCLGGVCGLRQGPGPPVQVRRGSKRICSGAQLLPLPTLDASAKLLLYLQALSCIKRNLLAVAWWAAPPRAPSSKPPSPDSSRLSAGCRRRRAPWLCGPSFWTPPSTTSSLPTCRTACPRSRRRRRRAPSPACLAAGERAELAGSMLCTSCAVCEWPALRLANCGRQPDLPKLAELAGHWASPIESDSCNRWMPCGAQHQSAGRVGMQE